MKIIMRSARSIGQSYKAKVFRSAISYEVGKIYDESSMDILWNGKPYVNRD